MLPDSRDDSNLENNLLSSNVDAKARKTIKEHSAMKTIFISIPWFTPAYKAGGPVQSISNMVQELQDGYRFYIYCSNEDLDGMPIDITHTNEWTSYNEQTKVWYARKQDRSQNLVQELEKIKPDYLYMVGIYSWHFTMVPLFFAKAANKIVSVRGML